MTFFDQEAPKPFHSIGGPPYAIMDECQDGIPQRFRILGRPASARRFVIL
jgi:hypothetical protein